MRDDRSLLRNTAGLLSVLFAIVACRDSGTELVDPHVVAREIIKEDALPAVAALAMSSSDVRYGAAGARRRGGPGNLQVSIFDRFAIGSMTKSMTATLAGILVEQGFIRWDARLYDVVPELASAGLADYAEVTLADLVTHSSGLYPVLSAEEFASIPLSVDSTPREQRIEWLQWAVTIVPAVEPGAEFEYSNSGYIAAAAMMERVMNQSYEQLMEDRLFRPLDINPRFESPAAATDLKQPWPHRREDTTQVWVAIDPRSEEIRFPAVANPAGGLSARLPELAAYLKMHLRARRGQRGLPISPETAEVLHTEVRALQSLGWVQTFDDKQRSIAFSAGSDEHSFYGMMAIAADRDRAAAVLTNGYDVNTEDELARALTRLLD